MSNLPQENWFYAHDGERYGPVTLQELRVKAAQGGLDPRLDLVWTQGMAEWKPAGEIDALFERRASDAPAATNPYQPPQDTSVADLMYQQEEWPGARRRAYLTATILLPFAWNLALGMIPLIVGMKLEPAMLQKINLAGAVLIVIVGVYYSLQRFVNLGMSRWWYLGNLVPFLNLWVGYRCFACPAGYAYHKRMDGIGIALAIFYWLVMVMMVLAVFALIFVLIKFANDPRVADLLRQFREAVEQGRSTAPSPR